MDCPNCGKSSPDEAPECASCGLVVAKWKARAEGSAPAVVTTRPAESDSRGGFWLLLVAAIVAVGIWRASSSGAGSQASSGLIDPTPYRGVIIDLEKTLYKDEPASEAAAQRIEVRGRQLSGQVSSAGTELGRQAGDWIQSFIAAVVTDGQNLRFTPSTRTEWIRRWEQLRADAFMQTGWFHEAVAFDQKAEMMEAAQAVQRLQDVCQALSALEDAGAQESEAAKSAEDEKERLETWRAWSKDWKTRVDQVARNLPSDKVIPSGLWDAHQSLRNAVSELRDVGNVDSDGSWLARAREWRQKANSMLEREASREAQSQ